MLKLDTYYAKTIKFKNLNIYKSKYNIFVLNFIKKLCINNNKHLTI